MSIKTPDDSGTPERFIAKERALIRRVFRARWGGARSLHEGFFLRRWRSGPQRGTPKVGAPLQSMLARGLVEIVDPEAGFPFACFTSAGIAALRALAQHRGMLPPDQYGHLIKELETFPDPQGRQRAPASEAPREPPSGPRPRRAVGRPPQAGGMEVRPVENSAFQEAFESLLAGLFDGKPTQTAEIIPFPTPSPAAQKPKPRR